MKMIQTVSRLVLPAAIAIASTSALATEHPPLGSVKIKAIEPKGSGCPTEESVAIDISDDAQAFTATFSEFAAGIGAGLKPTESRKNCALVATIEVPQGWQFSIASFNYRGYMALDKGIKASHATQYWFQGESETGYVKAEAQGPVYKDYVYSDKVGFLNVYLPDRWSPCEKDRVLVINPSVSLRRVAGASPSATGFIANDTVDGQVQNSFGLIWRRCS